MKIGSKLALSVALAIGAACAAATAPASAAVTYTFVGNFLNSNFAPPNDFFKITVPDFITSDQTFTSAQVNQVCGDAFIECTSVTFSTDYAGYDTLELTYIGGNPPDPTLPFNVFYYFKPTAFGEPGAYLQEDIFTNNATLTTALPEPSAWALMMLGVVLLGGALRSGRARRDGAAAAA